MKETAYRCLLLALLGLILASLAANIVPGRASAGEDQWWIDNMRHYERPKPRVPFSPVYDDWPTEV